MSMNKSSSLSVYKVCILLFFFILTKTTFGQNIVSNTADPRHETLNQRVISVLFDTNIASATTAGWSVTVNLVAVTVNSVVASGTARVIVTFDASPVHAGEPYLKPGEILRVSYSQATGNTLTTSGPEINNFTNIQSKNNFANLTFPPASAICTELVFFNVTDYGTPDVCAPVVMNFRQVAYKISLRLRNSSAFALYPLRYNTFWGDGSPNDPLLPVQSDLAGAPSPGFVNGVDPAFAGNPAIVLTARPTKNYPATTTPVPDICSWDARITPVFNGNAFCPSIAQNTSFASYDTDNANTGVLNMPFNPPAVGETTDRVCLGTNVNMRFTDLTQLNCRLAVESGLPNEIVRYIRIVYGSQNLPTNIPDIRVGGVPVTSNNAAGTHLFPVNPILGGPGYVPTGIGGVGVPDANGVIELATPVKVSTATAFMRYIATISATNQAVGDRFYVRLDYWDVCNPYKDPAGLLPSPFRPQVSIDNYVEIVTKPVPLTTTGLSICHNTANSTAFNFTASSSIGGARTGVNWYKNRASVGTATVMTNPNGANSLQFPAGSYGSQGGIGGNFTITNANGRYHSVWVTQIAGGTNGCESDPVEIVIIQQPRIDIGADIPSIPAGAIEVCNGPPAASEAYTTSVPAAKTINANNSTNGSIITLNTENDWSRSGYAATVNITPDLATTTATVTFNIAPQPNPTDAGQVQVRRQYKTGVADRISVVSPLPAPFTLPTYQITPQACPNNNVNLDVTVFGQSDGGTVTGSPTICDGQSTGNMVLSGHRGDVIRWERSFNAGAFVGIVATAGFTTYSEVPPNGAGTYKYRVQVQNQTGGPCAAVTTIVANQNTVTVNPVPPKPSISTSGPTTFCVPGSVTLTSTNTNAASYIWYKDGAPTGITTQNIVLSTVAQSGDYTVEVIGIAPSSCPSPLSDPTTVLVNPRPTATVAGGGSVCAGTPASDIVWTLTGTAPFNFTITITPGAPIVVNNYNSTTYTIVAPNPAGNTTYTITALTDANTCVGTSLGGSASVTVQATPPPTVESFTAQAAVCDDGGATNPPDAILDLLPNSVQNYAITYRLFRVSTASFLAGSINFTGNSSIAGVINLAPTYAQFGAVPNDPAGYQVVITAIQNTVTLCAGAVPINGPILIINPRPAVPTGPVNATACSAPGTGVALSVDDPLAGFEIEWSTAGPNLAAFVAAVPGSGAESGARNSVFTPGTSATATFYAFSRNTVTGCFSATGVAVKQTQDVKPANAIAGPAQPNLCTTSATLAATAANNGGTGTWTIVGPPGSIVITSPNSATSTVTGLPQDVPGGAPIATTLRWTVTSALTVCPSTFADVVLTTNPLPTIIDPAPHLCEDVAGGGTHANVDLTTYNAAVSNAPTITWYSDALRTMVVVAPVLVNNTTNKIFYFRAQSAVPCTNDGQITFTVDALPEAVDKTFEFCENAVGAGQAGNVVGNMIDLTSFEFGAGGVTNGGNAGNRDVEWYEDAALTTLISAGAGVGQEQNYVIVATQTIYAKVIDITSGVTPKCFDVADVTLTLKLRPVNNPITGSGTVCSGQTIVLYQVNPGLNPASTYTWNVAGAADFQVFGGGGTNTGNFFILLKFPGPTLGNVNISVFETVNGCDGNTSNFAVTVAGAPGALTFNAPETNVCKNQTGVVYSLNAPNPLSVYTWTAPGASFQGVSSGVGLSSVTLDFTTVNVTVSVTETSSSGCAGTPASVAVSLSDRPVMSSSSTTSVCSGNAPTLNFTATLGGLPTASVNFGWQVISVTGAVLGTTVGNTGIGNLSEVLTNTSGVIGLVTYRVTPTETAVPNPPNCPGIPQDVIVSVNPEPVLVTPQQKTICSGQPANYEILLTPSTLPVGTTFSWPLPTMSAGAAQGTVGTNVPGGGAGSIHITDVLTNKTASPITATYIITPTSGSGCPGVPQNVVITINPEPTVATTLDNTVCSDAVTGLTLSTIGGSVAAATYNITARTIGGGLTAAGGNAFVPAAGVAAGYLTNDVFTNLSANPLTVSYTVQGVSALGCVGAPQVITITINPEPVVANGLNTTVCSDQIINLTLITNGSSVAANTYNITSQTVAAGLLAGGTNAVVPAVGVGVGYLTNDVFTNTGLVPLNVTYTVVPVSAALCLGDPKIITMIINPEPVVATTLDKTVCSQAAIAMTLSTKASSVAAASYDITAVNIAPGLTAGGANVVVPQTNVLSNYLAADTYTNTGNASLNVSYTVVPKSGAGCFGDPQIITITINPEPTISATLDNTTCSDLAIGLNLNTEATSVAATSYNISARTMAGGLTPAGGNAFVPVVGVAAGYLAADKFTNLTATPLDVTYTVQGVSGAGCLGATRVITITINPEPVVSNTLDASACSDLPINLTLNTNGLSVAALTYNVTNRTVTAGLMAGGGNAVVPSAGVADNYLATDSYTNTGAAPLTVTYTIVPVSAIGCSGDPKVITITINPEPVISSGLNKAACSRAPIALTLTTNGTSVAALSYNISSINVDPGLTAGGANAVVPATGIAANYLAADTYANASGSALPVTYTVVPRSAAGCLGDPVVITITINPEPVMSATLDNTICSDLPTGLVLNTNGTSVGAASYNITARSIAAGLTPNGGNAGVPALGVAANFLSTDIFTNTGSASGVVTYTVVPVSSAGCLGVPVVVTMTINPEPVVSTTLDASICSSAATGLTLNTNGISVAAASYNISARTIAAGLTASAGNVVVPAAGVAAGYLNNDIFTNTGVAPLLVTYTVVPVTADGCLGNPKVITITVNPEPVVSSTLDAIKCSDAVIGLTFNTNGTSVAAANYNVTAVVPAAGLVANPANAIIPATGVAANYTTNDKFTNPTAVPLTVAYTVVAVSSVNCLSQPRLITITINPEPVVANSLDAAVCSDLTIGLTLATNGTSVAAANYNITARTVTAGLTGAGTNVAVPASGVPANYLTGEIFTNTGAISRTVTYTVVPVSASGCLGDAKNIIITIDPEPVVANGLNTTVCSDLPVAINLNTNGTSVAAGNYNITSRTIAAGLTPNGANAIIPATGVAAAYLATDKFTNLGAAALTVTYTVVPVSGAGCLGDPKIITATIDPEPVVSTSLNKIICSDAASALVLNTNGLSVAAANYNITARSVDPGLTPGATNAIVPAAAVANNYLGNDLFTNTGALPLNVTYTVEPVSAISCIGDPVVVTITVNPEPVLAGNLNLIQCSDIPTSLVLNTNGSSVSAQNYNITAISITAGLTAAGTNAVIPATGVNANYVGNDVFTNKGANPLTVTYTIVPVSAANCLGDAATVVVTINPEPVVSNALNTAVCSDVAIGLTLNTNGTSVAASDYNIISNTIAGGLTAGAGNAVVPANNVAANYLINDVYTNSGALPLDVTYTVVPRSADLCLGDAKIITITINPEPVVSTGLDAIVCSDLAIGSCIKHKWKFGECRNV
jgi:hypothetical protein